MEQEKVGIFIKNIRTQNGLTQKEFADKFGVTYQAVSKWENGKNLPDINILKEICIEYNISLDEVLNGDKKEETKDKNGKVNFLLVSLLFLVIILILILFSVFLKNSDDDFHFKTLSSTCTNFKVSGSIAYSDTKSSIYISHVDYCGKDEDTLYKNLKCVLYEVDGDIKKEISKYDYKEFKSITLEDFLSDVTFNIDNYTKICNEYQENSFLLEVDAINDEGEIYSHKIPLKLEDNC